MAIKYANKALLDDRSRFRIGRLNHPQIVRLEMIKARNYSDDEDLQRGALSAPRKSVRPGLHDDAVNGFFAGIMAIL